MKRIMSLVLVVLLVLLSAACEEQESSAPDADTSTTTTTSILEESATTKTEGVLRESRTTTTGSSTDINELLQNYLNSLQSSVGNKQTTQNQNAATSKASGKSDSPSNPSGTSKQSTTLSNQSVSNGVGEYTVTFDYGYGNKKAVAKSKNYKVAEPEEPTREGYVFNGWYTTDGSTKWVFQGYMVTENMTLVAHWVSFAAMSNNNEGSVNTTSMTISGTTQRISTKTTAPSKTTQRISTKTTASSKTTPIATTYVATKDAWSPWVD